MNDHGHQQIIIIKRGNEEEEGHHGGAWKIAFADFMTAMMALFLVLWLINAANEETKRAVASYFNPIKLVDRNRSTKGLEEQKSGSAGIEEIDNPENPDQTKPKQVSPTTPLDVQGTSVNGAEELNSDAKFFADPMAALDKIEASVLEKSGISNSIETKGEDAKPGKFTDPFNVGFWQDNPKPNESQGEGPADAASGEKNLKPAPKVKPVDPASEKIEADRTAEAAELENTVHREIEKSLGENALLKDAIKIKQTEKGILIQIFDLPSTPMFDIGKAVPTGETVVAINAVAKALSKKSGNIRIYGHTDSRKFGNVGNGNWRLSVDRSQSVYLMLLRAGLADSRFSEITGFADRKPVVVNDPLASQNRRIEIFLENA